MVKYVVKDEHTLGYIFDSMSEKFMCVLSGSVLRGGHDCKNGIVNTGNNIRPATKEDFDFFRVVPPLNFES